VCGYKLEDEKLARKVSIRVEARPEILQRDKSVMSIVCEIVKLICENLKMKLDKGLVYSGPLTCLSIIYTNT